MFIPWVGKILGSGPLVYLGKISIYIYLIHYPVQCMFELVHQFTGKDINYSAGLIWLFYAFAVLVLASFYDIILADKVKEFVCGFLVRKPEKE